MSNSEYGRAARRTTGKPYIIPTSDSFKDCMYIVSVCKRLGTATGTRVLNRLSKVKQLTTWEVQAMVGFIRCELEV